jgi:phosphatidylinositol-3,4,5-trisphosphate 3-phosphatase and dual-specificity protein phosphatase PTEN
MDYLRTIVSGKKKRHIEAGFNLDLSYITPRIIAMSIPGEGLTGLYRNSLCLVSDFLETKHRGHYLIFNLSGISYNYERFGDQVKEFPWQDHYPPPIDLLFRACREIEIWLKPNPQNIVVVNCRAGKGRTGTLICCYLLYSGRFTTAFSALSYYQHKRFKEGGGVTQPSQVRYVSYFADIITGKTRSPLVLKPISMHFRTAPHMNGDHCTPIVELYYNDRIIYSSKQRDRDSQIYLCDNWEDNRLHIAAIFDQNLLLQGDILCRVIQWGKFRCSNICRFSFNTGFVPYNKVLVLRRYEVDPYSLKKSTQICEKFSVIIEFEQMCQCIAEMEIRERCENCLRVLNEEEKVKWEEIARICKNRNVTDPIVNLFGRIELDDVDDIVQDLDQTADFELNEM